MLNILYEKYDLSRRLVIHHIDILSLKEYLELTYNTTFQNYTLDEILTNSSDIPHSYLAVDIDFTINDKKIPLYLFGFLY